MTTAQVVETSVTVNNNSPIQDYVHPDDETQPTFISKSVEQTKKSRKILHHCNTAHIFWSFPNKMSQAIWFSNQNFLFSQVNGNYPRKSNKES